MTSRRAMLFSGLIAVVAVLVVLAVTVGPWASIPFDEWRRSAEVVCERSFDRRSHPESDARQAPLFAEVADGLEDLNTPSSRFVEVETLMRDVSSLPERTAAAERLSGQVTSGATVADPDELEKVFEVGDQQDRVRRWFDTNKMTKCSAVFEFPEHR